MSQIKEALLIHYSAPLETSFKQFKHGAVFFGIGLIIVLMSNQVFAPSIKQESAVMVGLLILAYGFLMAMLAQIRMLISRILQYVRKSKDIRDARKNRS